VLTAQLDRRKGARARAAAACEPSEARVLRSLQESFPDGTAAWLVEGDVRRMFVATRGDETLALAKLKEAVRWKSTTLDGWLAREARSLPTAETRVIAIGHDSRPMVYSGCVNQRPGEVAGVILACVWHRALQEAGPTAQMDYVLDAYGYQPLLNMNIMPYLNVARHIDSFFAERFHRIVIIDVPRVLVWVIKAILPLMPAKTREKVVFVQRDAPEQMAALFDLCAGEEMKVMLQELLKMNGPGATGAAREATHELTERFRASQHSGGPGWEE